MKPVLTFLWNNRTTTLGALQIIVSQIATSGLLADKAVKWCMLISGIATGLVGLMNTLAQRRAEKAAQETQP